MELPHQSSNTCRLARPRNCTGQRSEQVSASAPAPVRPRGLRRPGGETMPRPPQPEPRCPSHYVHFSPSPSSHPQLLAPASSPLPGPEAWVCFSGHACARMGTHARTHARARSPGSVHAGRGLVCVPQARGAGNSHDGKAEMTERTGRRAGLGFRLKTCSPPLPFPSCLIVSSTAVCW